MPFLILGLIAVVLIAKSSSKAPSPPLATPSAKAKSGTPTFVPLSTQNAAYVPPPPPPPTIVTGLIAEKAS